MATLIGAATYRAPLIQTPRARHSETIYYNKQNAIINFFYYFPKKKKYTPSLPRRRWCKFGPRTWPVRSQTQFPGQLNTRLIYDGHENNWFGQFGEGGGGRWSKRLGLRLLWRAGPSSIKESINNVPTAGRSRSRTGSAFCWWPVPKFMQTG